MAMGRITNPSAWVWNYLGISKMALTTYTPTRTKELGVAISRFLVRTIVDANSTPRTNPLSWWLVVLIQKEVVEDQPRWALADIKDSLNFKHKLKAISHYTPAIILSVGFDNWGTSAKRYKEESVMKWLA
jgi:hypothetical protein